MLFPDIIFHSHLTSSHARKGIFAKRASLCVPARCMFCGSITVEAAAALPLFFFAVLALCCMLEVTAVRTSIRCGLQYAGKAAAETAYAKPFLLPGSIEQDLVQAAGADRLDRSLVENGSGGIRCEGSRMSMVTGIMELEAAYRVRLPLPVFGGVSVPMEESLRVKGWTGYEKAGLLTGEEETVYVTETGMVYHRDYHCTYLELSIQMVPASALDGLRNESQGKYYPCSGCVHGEAHGLVYVTDYGEKYHSSLSCSGLKRTVYAVPLSEAVGKGACSKCG